jgi:hypothetical protein
LLQFHDFVTLVCFVSFVFQGDGAEEILIRPIEIEAGGLGGEEIALKALVPNSQPAAPSPALSR